MSQPQPRTDPVTAFARRHCKSARKGKLERAALARHLTDLEEQDKTGFYFDADAALRVIDFFSAYLMIVETKSGRKKPFVLLPWQQFVVGSIFGWKVGKRDSRNRLPHTRRYRTAYLETAKGSGKTPLAAGLAIYMLLADKDRDGVIEPQPEVYCCGAIMEQSMIAFRDMKEMIHSSVELAGLCKVHDHGPQGGRISSVRVGGFIQALGMQTSGRGRSGYRPHMILVDEFHEHSTRHQLQMMDANTKGRRQPLTFIATNAGCERLGPCWDERNTAEKNLRGIRRSSSYFAYICAIDREDLPAPEKNPKCWWKANPSLGSIIRRDYLKGQIEKNRDSPDRMRDLRRLNFGIWPDASDPFIEWEAWQKAELDPFPSDAVLKDMPCFLGVDLAAISDMTAVAALWEGAHELYAKVRYFTPEDTLASRHQRSSGELLGWAEDGRFLTPVPGAVLSYETIAQHIKELTERYDVKACAIDPYHMYRLIEHFGKLELPYWVEDGEAKHFHTGLQLVRHPQIYAQKGHADTEKVLWMPGSIGDLESALHQQSSSTDDKALRVEVNPLLRWNCLCAVTQSDSQGNRRWEKRKSFEKNQGSIDGLVALCMAVGMYTRGTDPSLATQSSALQWLTGYADRLESRRA